MKIKKMAAAMLGTALLFTTITACGTENSAGPKNASPTPASEKITLTVWHDKGDEGIKYINELNEQYKKINPNVEIVSTSFPTPQWTEKTLASIVTNSAPDLIFNDGSRVLEIQQKLGQLEDLGSVLEASEGKEFVKDGDKSLASFENELVVLPVNRVLAGLGVRKSWLEKVNGQFPETWEQFVQLGKDFTEKDPDSNGVSDTSGFIMHLGKDPGQIFNLLINGSGNKQVWINDTPAPSFLEPDRVDRFKQIVSLMTEDKIIAKDALTHSFTEMYQVIESGKVGMFRVGNWNVAKWDQNDILKDDYVVGAYPAMTTGDKPSYVQLNVRGFAVPENAPHKEEAIKFLETLLTVDAQQSSFDYFGSAMRPDLTIEASETLKPFLDESINLVPVDTNFTKYKYYSELNERFEKMVQELFVSPIGDADSIMQRGANDLTAIFDKNK